MCFYTWMAGRSNPKKPERCILHRASTEKRRIEGTRRNLKTTQLLKSYLFFTHGWPAGPTRTNTERCIWRRSGIEHTYVQRHSEQELYVLSFTLRRHVVPIRHSKGDPMKYECIETQCFCKVCVRRLRHIATDCMACAWIFVEIRINFRHAEGPIAVSLNQMHNQHLMSAAPFQRV